MTYEGYDDSDWNVSGDITIHNTGSLDAVITGVEDNLGGTLIDVDCGVTFPYTLEVDDTLVCTYNYDGYVVGVNVATVTTQVDTYDSGEVSIVWGDPTNEIDESVDVYDTSDLFGEVYLGTVTAPHNGHFTSTHEFDWNDYKDADCGDHTYNNTAEIIGVDSGLLDDASASLNVHVQCHIFEIAYAKGTGSICFIPTFSNWGWYTPITRGTSLTMDVYAGAAQCDINKGTWVGTVTVTYSASTGLVIVIWDIESPFSIKETHVYAGTTPFPKFKGVYTVAPGQYTNKGPFTASQIYVIVHAVVGIPDSSFGEADTAY